MDNNTRCEKVFRALANPARIRIISLLDGNQFCVNALVRQMDISQAAVSQHLKILENAGLVKKKKEGYWMHYTLSPGGFNDINKFLSSIRELNQNAE